MLSQRRAAVHAVRQEPRHAVVGYSKLPPRDCRPGVALRSAAGGGQPSGTAGARRRHGAAQPPERSTLLRLRRPARLSAQPHARHQHDCGGHPTAQQRLRGRRQRRRHAAHQRRLFYCLHQRRHAAAEQRLRERRPVGLDHHRRCHGAERPHALRQARLRRRHADQRRLHRGPQHAGADRRCRLPDHQRLLLGEDLRATGPSYATSTALGDFSCSSCGSWATVTRDATPYLGQAITLECSA